MSWRRFSSTLILTCMLVLGVLYLLVLVIDPYDSVAFSPDWKRYPVSRHSRDYNAILARRPEYDSAVIGTSTSMLLHPDELNRELGGRFVMLAMPAASPFEQLELLRLFHRHHAYIRTLVIGLDVVWCHASAAPHFLGLMANQPFPYWLYDENPWNDLPPLNHSTLKKARMQLRALLGIRIRYPYKPDGYWDFTEALYDNNDAESVRDRLYDANNKQPLPAPGDDTTTVYPDLSSLKGILAQLPAETEKILFFAPYHHFQLPEPGSTQMTAWEECKRRAAMISAEVPRTLVVDFMIHSRITEDDANYIDGQHYTIPIASELVRLLSDARRGETDEPSELRLLSRSDQ
jgi:hypothetical protein